MKSIVKISIFAVFLTGIIIACQRVPLTNRKQFVGLVSGSQMMELSFAQ